MDINEFIAEEEKGIKDYEALLAQTTDANTRWVIGDILNDEKRHVAMLKSLSVDTLTNAGRAVQGRMRYSRQRSK